MLKELGANIQAPKQAKHAGKGHAGAINPDLESVQDYCRTLVADIANTWLYQLEGGVFNLPCITVVYTQQCHSMVLRARQRAPTLVDDRAAQALEQAAHMQPSSGPSGPTASAVGGETEKEESRSIHLSGDPEDNTQMLFEQDMVQQ